MNAKCAFACSFQDVRQKTYQRDLKENLHITNGFSIAGNQATSIERRDVTYAVQRVSTATHVAKVQYCICLPSMLRTIWKMVSGKRATF